MPVETLDLTRYGHEAMGRYRLVVVRIDGWPVAGAADCGKTKRQARCRQVNRAGRKMSCLGME